VTKEKLRVVLLYSTGHLGSAIVLNLLRKKELEVVGIVRASPRYSHKNPKNFLVRIGAHFGLMLLWERLVRFLFYGVAILRSLGGYKTYLPGWWIAWKYRIPTYYCRNVNEEACERFIRNLEPDLIVSAYFSQIVKPNILALAKLGALNIHPGWLPAYRGAMSYFWVLRNNEQWGGVSVHWMDEGIDTGQVVAQKRFPLDNSVTQHQVLVKTAVIGSRLAQQVIRKLLRGEKLEPVAAEPGDGQYYAFPDAQAFAEYFRSRRFFRIRNLLRMVIRGRT